MKKKLLAYVFIFFALFSFLGFFPSSLFAGNPPDAANSSLLPTSAGSNEVPADGVTQASVTVTLQDSFGTPLAGDDVALTSSDPNIVISPASATLDGSGTAVFTATSTTVGTDDIDVTDTSTGTTLTALGQIIFDPLPTPTPTSPAKPSPCSYSAPADAPNLYSVSMTGSSATLYWTQPQSPFDSYTVSYGLTPSADAYAVQFSMGRLDGAVKYKINDLFPKTNYYFKVLANNGCANGPWSQTISTNVSGAGSLPTTGPSVAIISIGIAGITLALVGLATFLFIL